MEAGGAAKAEEKSGEKRLLNPVARVILQGLCDEESPFRKLNGLWHVLRNIWKYVANHYKRNIKSTPTEGLGLGKKKEFEYDASYLNLMKTLENSLGEPILMRGNHVAYNGDLIFPKPSRININMMPFVIDRDFKKCKLPDYLRSYWEDIICRCPIPRGERGKIWFLTIQESFAKKGASHRRSGIHVETPGRIELTKSDEEQSENTNSRGKGHCSVNRHKIYPTFWGGGSSHRIGESVELEGGIFMASNVDNSCKVWNCKIMDDNLIGKLGDVDHLVGFLTEGEEMKKNQLYWLTDRTPHESLPLKRGTLRAFFRLVTSQVSIWYEDHSTKNPLGVVPDPSITQIVKGSKFDDKGLFVV